MMREKPTAAEQALWEAICSISAREGWDIERQSILCGYIADIFIRNKNVVVEVDGSYHNKPAQIDSDQVRESVLNHRGIRVYRITNDSVLINPKAASDSVRQFVDAVAPLYYFSEQGYSSLKKAARELKHG